MTISNLIVDAISNNYDPDSLYVDSDVDIDALLEELEDMAAEIINKMNDLVMARPHDCHRYPLYELKAIRKVAGY